MHARCWVLRDRAGASVGRHTVLTGPLDLVVAGFRACRTGYRPYFENYTVDASIFRFNTLRVLGR